jgi:hypothetical protein
MKPVTLLVLGLALAGCDGGESMGGGTPAPPVTTSFTQFVKAQVTAPSETATSTEVEATIFVFPGDSEETVFNDVLPP